MPARFDSYGKIWSKFLKNEYLVNTVVKLEKTEDGFWVTIDGKADEPLELTKTEVTNVEFKEAESPSPVVLNESALLGSKQKIVIIDANNVAYWGLPDDPVSGHPKPSYDQLADAEAYFVKQGYRVIMYADPPLMRYIDKKEDFMKRVRAKEIRISPPDVEADVNILNVAIASYPKAIVVTNDRYDDHLELLRRFKAGGGSLLRFDTENKKFIPMNYT